MWRLPPLLPLRPPCFAAATLARVAGLASFCLACLGLAGCTLYTSGIGYRARQAVLRNDVEAFADLMEEASETEPIRLNDDPKKTVLTHFLDLAADRRFFPFIEKWRRRGWIGKDMTCAIHRARYRAVREKSPEDATRAANICLDRARAAAANPDLRWEIDECLEEAPFLALTSTKALLPFLRIAADSTEPRLFRAGILDGMTRLEVSGPDRRRGNDASLTQEQAMVLAETELSAVAERFRYVISAMRPFVDVSLLAGGTAMGAMEIERVSVDLGRSFIGPMALSADPFESDLAWGWVRSLKARKRTQRLASLALWNKSREPRGDTFWYLCSRLGGASLLPASEIAAALDLGSSRRIVDAISIRATDRVRDIDALRKEQCLDVPSGEPYPGISGPFPLEATARATVTASIAALHAGEGRIALSVRRRKIL